MPDLIKTPPHPVSDYCGNTKQHKASFSSYTCSGPLMSACDLHKVWSSTDTHPSYLTKKCLQTFTFPSHTNQKRLKCLFSSFSFTTSVLCIEFQGVDFVSHLLWVINLQNALEDFLWTGTAVLGSAVLNRYYSLWAILRTGFFLQWLVSSRGWKAWTIDQHRGMWVGLSCDLFDW